MLDWMDLADTKRVGRVGHCLCFLTRVIVGISVVSQDRQKLLVYTASACPQALW